MTDSETDEQIDADSEEGRLLLTEAIRLLEENISAGAPADQTDTLSET